MNSTDKKAPRQRRPQAERSAETRIKLIEAAITCLNATGYSATTVSTVAEAAGVSRGAMTHQFPAKTDLMLAVVEHVFEEDSRLYAEHIANSDPKQFLLDLPETMWGVISRPAGIAVIEIMMASRSDVGLATRLRDLQSRIDIRAHKWSGDRMRAAGFEPHPDGEAIHEVFVAAVRGLAIEATFMDNRESVRRSIAVLSAVLRQLHPALQSDKPRK